MNSYNHSSNAKKNIHKDKARFLILSLINRTDSFLDWWLCLDSDEDGDAWLFLIERVEDGEGWLFLTETEVSNCGARVDPELGEGGWLWTVMVGEPW